MSDYHAEFIRLVGDLFDYTYLTQDFDKAEHILLNLNELFTAEVNKRIGAFIEETEQ